MCYKVLQIPKLTGIVYCQYTDVGNVSLKAVELLDLFTEPQTQDLLELFTIYQVIYVP